MYHPVDPNTEYIELTNIGAETIDLNLVTLTDGVDFAFPSVEVAPGDYVLVVEDTIAFEARYGPGFPIAGQYSGRLNNAGEQIELRDAAGQIIHSFEYSDDWYEMSDGLGFSLTMNDPVTTDPNALDEKSTWRPSVHDGGSPGFDDSAEAVLPDAVLINEVMAAPLAGESDWIELYNTTDQAIDLGGWYLSDSGNNLTKYEIAAGTILEPDGYVVFYEDLHFGNDDAPGCHSAFGLSRDGETVYLHSGSGGIVTGYSTRQSYGPSEPGTSFGHYRGTAGEYGFIALSVPTPGEANAEP